MTEEVKVEEVSNDPSESAEISPIEQRAREMGWKPMEDFHGDEVDFVDAKEFVQRQPLFEKIESQSKQLKNALKTVEALKTHYTSVRETEYKRALAALEAQREQAVSEADGAKFTVVDKQIKEVEQQFAEIKSEETRQNTQNDPSEFVSWKTKNEWYEKDETMRVFADAYGTKLAREGNLTPGEVLQAVSKKVRSEFTHKFVNPNKGSAPDVNISGGTQRANSSERYDLNETEKQIMNTLIRSGTMTKEQYIADLKKIKASR